MGNLQNMATDRKQNILIIDDDLLFCDMISQHLADINLNAIAVNTAADGLKVCAQQDVDIVLLDQKLPDGEGKDLCPSILSYNEQCKIIFITAHPSFENAVEAVRVGAHDYLPKPFELDELTFTINRALKTIDLEKFKQVQTYRNIREQEENILVGKEGGLKDVHHLIEVAADHDAPVLITGETGTGKTMIARSIHYRSSKKESTFISINCAALPENLIEAELFGFEKGAFTGAVTAKKGIFEMAEGGTLCLEEIGELPYHLQSNLLGVLDDGMIKRIGGQTLRPVNVRIIATTNVDLEKAVAAKDFRQDLFYRLSVLRIHIPPLRYRVDDIPQLCRFFMWEMAPASELLLSDEELTRLLDYPWPGNVRELKNVIERSIILRERSEIYPSKLLSTRPARRSYSHPLESRFRLIKNGGDPDLIELEKQYIAYMLDQNHNNHSWTAEALGVSRSTLIRKIKQYGIKPIVSRKTDDGSSEPDDPPISESDADSASYGDFEA